MAHSNTAQAPAASATAPVPLAAWVAVALGCVGLLVGSSGMAGSGLGALLFLALWGLVLAMLGPRALALVLRRPWLLALPALALTSVLWSWAPGASLRAGVQLLLTCGFAILAARLLPPRRFLSALTISLAMGVLLCLVFGRYALDPFSGARPFVGIFGSKNAMAFFMALVLLSGGACAMDRAQPALVRLLGAALFPLALPLIVMANSAGALVTTALAFMALLGSLTLGRLGRPSRVLLLAGAALVALPLGALLALLAVQGQLGAAAADFITGVLGKDLTLTGRTVLWGHALGEIAQRPWTGTGYQAFWQQGNPLAEMLWRLFQIESRSGFHFHNTYLDTAVALGIPGMLAIAWLLFRAAFGGLARVLETPNWPRAALLAIAVSQLLRSFVEVEGTYPFSLGTFLLIAGATYAGQRGNA